MNQYGRVNLLGLDDLAGICIQVRLQGRSMKPFLFQFVVAAPGRSAADMRQAQVDSICEKYQGDTADVTVHDFQRMCGLAGYKGTK